MGRIYQAECKECGSSFEVSEGGGFTFHLLRCDLCANTKTISFKEIGEPHYAFLKGLKVPYSIATKDSDRHIQKAYSGKPLSREDYYAAVEKVAGQCRCGGSFKMDAEPRCPHCRSTNLMGGETKLLYD